MPVTAPTTASPVSPSPVSATSTEPASHIIVVCNIGNLQPPTGEINFYDASTGRPVGQPIVPTSANQYLNSAGGGRFQPTGFGPNSGGFVCDRLSYDPTFEWIAGIDTYSNASGTGDAVPAMYNLVTGQVKDTVQPVSNNGNGFTPTPVTTYITAAFNYHNGDFWAVKLVDPSHVILVGPDGQQIPEDYSYDSTSGSPPTLDFPNDGRPVLVDPSLNMPDATSPDLDPSILQDTYSQTYDIRRPDNGKGSLAAFTEVSQNNQQWGLFTVPLNGGVPTLLSSYPEEQAFTSLIETPLVIRYLP